MQTIAIQTYSYGYMQQLGPGPWDQEPDLAYWQSQGLPCMLRRAGSMGHWCGYVGVGPQHPWYGCGYDRVPAEVHGGLTYADNMGGVAEEELISQLGGAQLWWLGFDCAHSGDFVPGLARYSTPGSAALGMADGPGIYRDYEYVLAEVEALAGQAAHPKPPHPPEEDEEGGEQ